MKTILPILVVCLIGFSLLGLHQAYATQIVKFVLCNNDAIVCPGTNYTLIFPVVPGIQAALHYGDCADSAIQTYQLSNHTWICGNQHLGTITSGQNIGKGGKGVYAGISGANLQFKNVTSTTTLITTSSNGTDVNLGSSFKANTKTCSNQWLSAFDNATGLFTCSTVTGFLTSLNGDTTAAQNIVRGKAGNVTITNSTGKVTINTGYDIPLLSGIQTFTGNTTEKFGSGGIIIRNPASTFATKIIGAAQTANRSATLPVTTQNTIFSMQPSYNFSSQGNVTGTSATTLKMSGKYVTLIPRYSTNATININGFIYNSAATDSCLLDIRQSTSNMGIAGTAVTGSKIGSNERITSPTAQANMTLSKTVLTTGLTTGTKYYFDISFAAITGGYCKILNLDWYVTER